VTSKLLVKLLEEQGFAPRKLSLADAADRLPDCELLLLDVPASSGPNASVEDALANANKHHVPVVVTAKGDHGSRLAARAAAVLTKPVAPDVLEKEVRTHVERRLQVAAARAKAPTGQVPKPVAATLRVLIVDDSRVIRGVVREALAEVGVTAVEAEDGAEALLAFAQARPDAVISDLQMPGVDGAKLIPMLRERSKDTHVPIVVLSALEDEGSRKAALAAGADAYLVKSIIDGPALMRALKAAGLPLGS
jgi:two-component system, chemotaxis family, chemotaxis protein CheY